MKKPAIQHIADKLGISKNDQADPNGNCYAIKPFVEGIFKTAANLGLQLFY
ncbi:hypothetical protein [Cytobacillus sp. AMY 15.2]|uniref:hypothetical protein n=1 Tax=Cytobacillus sp. AMY 15.2 TaxID=2939563 RepID=UPI0020407111|nr:hypothetical protein [Cytobacillus sp. AMY 15.2]